MAGRKETWKKDLKENAIKIILNRIAEGESVREILSKDRDQSVLPSRKLFYEWVANDKSLSDHYARALDDRHDLIFEEILQIADKKGDHHDRRLQIDARKWVLGRMNPAKYGDRIQTESKVEITNSDLTDAELDAKIAELEKKHKK